MTHAAHPARTRLVLSRDLLIKAEHHHSGMYKHGAGYYLLNGRWHSVKAGKPAPKGAPVAAHKHAAGQFEAVKHFTDEQWQKLKLPPENTNAASFNKQLGQLKAMSEAGDVTGILGMSVGSNTYGKKLATIANHLLGLHGTEHKVTPGQKAGAHAAVQNAPAEPAPAQEPPAVEAPETVAQPAPEPATAPGLAMPEFAEGKTTTGVKAYYDAQAKKVLELAAAGDVAGLQQLKADGSKPNAKGKVPNTWAGKTANSKTLIALHEQALQQLGASAPAAEQAEAAPAPAAKPPRLMVSKEVAATPAAPAAESAPASKIDQIPWDSQLLPDTNSNAKSHNGQVAKIKAMAYAGDTAGLQAFIDAKAGAKQTYAKKQALLAQTALAGLNEGGAAPAAATTSVQAAPDGFQTPDGPLAEHVKNTLDDKAAAGDVEFLQNVAANNPEHPQIVAYAQAKLAELDAAKKAPEPAPAKPATVAVDAAVFHNTQPGHNKFWSVSVQGTAMKTVYGKIGSKGQSTTKTFSSEAAAQAAAGKLLAEKKAKGYEYAGSMKVEHDAPAGAAAVDQGPKDGDTKPGADGMLVFKDGHWHKQEQPSGGLTGDAAFNLIDQIGGMNSADEAKAAALNFIEQHGKTPEAYAAAVEALNLGEFGDAADAVEKLSQPQPSGPAYGALLPKHAISLGKGLKTAKGMKDKLKGMAVSGDAAGLQAFIDGAGSSMPASKQYAKNLLQAMGEAAAAGAPAIPAKAKPKPAAAPAAAEPEAIPSMDAWVQTGGQGGSNPGGKFKDPSGQEWYCKFPGDDDVAKSEVLAAKLYALAGLQSQQAQLVTKGGKIGIASKWVDVKKAGSPAALAAVQDAQAGFAVDAWLGNWDVVGLGYDNLQIGADGKAVRVDAGGSLEYRAQGSKKPFGAKVEEIDTLRDAKVNQQAASVFGSMTNADISASVAKVLAISDAQIRALVAEHGPGDMAKRKELANTLIARKADLLARFPKAAKSTKKRLDPTKLPVNAAQLPKPHDFANWNGPGMGLSSKAHVNAANQAVEQQAYDAALQGNLVALKDFKYHGIDKDTGNATGQAVPIAQHPSKHVVQYHADLVQALDEIANPPQPLKVFRETEVGTLAAIDAAFPPKPFGTTVASVSSSEKMGFWVALGAVAGSAKFAPKKVMDYTAAAVAAAKAKYKDAKPLAKHFIKSVQASGSYNDLFRDGKTHDYSGNKLTDVAQAALEHATEMPEGTSVYRWQKMTDQMLKHIMAAPDGTVFQATGPMCTSYSPTATQGFGTHRIVIRYAKGAKAVESFASGGFAGEKEVTTLPNNRFIILSKKMVPDVEHGNPQGKRAEIEVLMLPPDLGIPGVKG